MWMVIHRHRLTDVSQTPRLAMQHIMTLPLVAPMDCTHLFVDCRFTWWVWQHFHDWMNIDFPIPSDDFLNFEDWWLKDRRITPKSLHRDFDAITISIQ